MSPLFALGAGVLIAFLAMRTARRHAHDTAARVAPRRPRPRPISPAHDRLAEDDDYATAMIAGMEDALRRAREERTRDAGARAPWSSADAARARRAVAPLFGVTMRVKP